MVDSLARRFPDLFAETVAREVMDAVGSATLPYPNLRYSASGELVGEHIPALKGVAARGVHLWGYTRSVKLAVALSSMGAAVILSCDASTAGATIEEALLLGIPLAYTSLTVDDLPPDGTVVTFPVHRVGRVSEVPDVISLCPKVLEDFFYEARSPAMCQTACNRCHNPQGIER